MSPDWPTTGVVAGQTLRMDLLATAAHSPSVWDVWMTRETWDPNTPLRWSEMEFLGRPAVTFTGSNYLFDVEIPVDRTGHHVLWVAWQRNDPAGEVFFSTSDVDVRPVNDECAGALTIPEGSHGPFSVESATPSRQAASCEAAQGADVWVVNIAFLVASLCYFASRIAATKRAED